MVQASLMSPSRPPLRPLPPPRPSWIERGLGLLPDGALTALHRAVHQEWRRREPRGAWPAAELAERRREVLRELVNGRPVGQERSLFQRLLNACLAGRRAEARRLADEAAELLGDPRAPAPRLVESPAPSPVA